MFERFQLSEANKFKPDRQRQIPLYVKRMIFSSNPPLLLQVPSNECVHASQMTPWRHQKATFFSSHVNSTTSHIGISEPTSISFISFGPNEPDFQPHRLARIARCDTIMLMYTAKPGVASLLFLASL